MGGYDRQIAQSLESIAKSQERLAKAWGSADSDRIQQSLGAVATQLQAINFRLDNLLPKEPTKQDLRRQALHSLRLAGFDDDTAVKWVDELMKNVEDPEPKPKPIKDERVSDKHIRRILADHARDLAHMVDLPVPVENIISITMDVKGIEIVYGTGSARPSVIRRGGPWIFDDDEDES